MGMRLESTSGGQMGSSSLPLQEGSQPAAPRSLLRRADLPERYNVPLLELLIVDPYFIFISWEISAEQLQSAQERFGDRFDQRRLRVLISNADNGEVLTARELYGELGRWFIQLNHPGRWIRAELLFQLDNDRVALNTAGNVFVPRDTPVEPVSWEELFVQYGRNERGELHIESLQRETPAWPDIRLSANSGADPRTKVPTSYREGEHSDAAQLRPLLPLQPPVTHEEEPDD